MRAKDQRTRFKTNTNSNTTLPSIRIRHAQCSALGVSTRIPSGFPLYFRHPSSNLARPMLSYTLNDGNSIPWLGYGTGTALYQKEASNEVKTAIEYGVTHLDTAQVYENEDAIGSGLKASGKPRESVFITTKFNPAMGTDHVDLFLIHAPYPLNQRGELKNTWKEMEDIKKEGLAKSIGVSNYRVKDLEEILNGATIIPAVNQIEYHPYVLDTAEEIYKFCTEKGIRLASYSGLTPVTSAKGGPVDLPLAAAAKRLSKETGKQVSPANVLTKWLLQRDFVVITTTSKSSRITEMLSIPDLPELTAAEIEAIETEGKKYHKRMWMHHVFGEQR